MEELLRVPRDARMTFMIILGLYMVFMLAVGFLAMGRVKKVADYYLGGRSIGPLVLGFTYIATYSSASAYIGAPGLAYKFGLSGVWETSLLCGNVSWHCTPVCT
jgi:Na+/proline symporter